MPFPVRSLHLLEEMCTRSLLITTHNGFQYRLVLEEFRGSLESAAGRPSPTTTASGGNNTDWNNYYLACLLNLPTTTANDDDDVVAWLTPPTADLPDFR